MFGARPAYHARMPTDASVKAAAWQLYEAAKAALLHLDTAADRGGVECRRMLRAAIIAAGGELPSGREASEQAWDRLLGK